MGKAATKAPRVPAKLREAFQFFMDHAGYATPPGREACALSLARAESWAKAREDAGALQYLIEDEDMDPADSFTEPDDIAFARAHPWLCLALQAKRAPCDRCGLGGGWETVASIGGVSVKSMNDPYIRVLKAELAHEAMAGSRGIGRIPKS